MQYTVIDAPRRQNVEFYGPSDPFDRPMFLFVSHRTLNGTPFVLSLAIYLFEWQGSVVVDADIQQVHTRNQRTTEAIQLVIPHDPSQENSDEQGQHLPTQAEPLPHLTN
ncbi:hypothetical protein TRAPUB_9520 [Trametes pubescens]|nr:hypothetical protein TRAPUB_9520 [Trametes pubescens]